MEERQIIEYMVADAINVLKLIKRRDENGMKIIKKNDVKIDGLKS